MGSVRFPELQISISFFWHQDHQGFPFDRVLVMFALNQNNNLCSAKNGEPRHSINLILATVPHNVFLTSNGEIL
jgi:hypothetical protein